uniref:Uncharacterized protein n=1 Tax=Rhizophora mucronata TaxID=61149 RepID=A0A2P2Q2I4_RHIMU
MSNNRFLGSIPTVSYKIHGIYVPQITILIRASTRVELSLALGMPLS